MKLKQEFEQAMEVAVDLNKREEAIQQPINDYSYLEKLQEDLEVFEALWTNYKNFEEKCMSKNG